MLKAFCLSLAIFVAVFPTSLDAKNKDIVRRIEVRGEYFTSKSDIYEVLSLKHGDSFNQVKLDRQAKALQSSGVYKAVTATSKDYKDGKSVRFTVDENTLVGKIQFEGSSVFTEDELNATISSRPNEIYNINTLREDVRAIDTLYREGGYIQAKVYSIAKPQFKNGPLIFKISEGVIDAITITGNNKTKDYVIRRELVSKPGMVVHDATIREDIRRIFNLNYFEAIEPHFPESSTPNHYTLDLNIVERDSNAQFSFGGGYSPRVGFSMFTDLYWDNFFGTGQLVALKSQFGRATTYQFKYYNPWMWDDRKSLTVKTWLTSGEVSAVNPLDFNDGFRDEESKGLEVGIGWPYSYEFRSSHFAKYEEVFLTELNEKYSITSYTLGLSYDTRDVRHLPLNGLYYSFFAEMGLGLGGRTLPFSKYDLSMQHYKETFENQTIATRFSFGLLKSPRIEESEIFSREIYYLGGSNTIRGYEEWPPVSQGTKKALTTIEYRFHFNEMFQLVFFTDAGYATNGYTWNLSQWDVGKGIGARIRTPLGPLKLDFGLNNKNEGRFHFNLGYSF